MGRRHGCTQRLKLRHHHTFPLEAWLLFYAVFPLFYYKEVSPKVCMPHSLRFSLSGLGTLEERQLFSLYKL